MKKSTIVLTIFAIILAALGIFLVLGSEHALVTHPKGIIARSELDLIITNILLMLVIIVPTLVVLFVTAWKYRSKNAEAQAHPEQSRGIIGQAALWIIPAIIVAVMAPITWKATHKLDPFRPIEQPLESKVKPLTIQVLALDWKWVFIYPEQGIATVNFVQFPDLTPIHFTLAADGSPMNSFWIPELSGQIYAMTGMVTQLHVMAHGPGEYRGRAAEINGAGYAGMTFIAKSSSDSDFEAWVKSVKESPQRLDYSGYSELLKRSINHPVTLYSYVEKNLFDEVVMKPMHPQKTA